MAERAALAGGRLRVQSSEGHGTRIRGHFKMAPSDS
jgi:signal transduction histidine kinase